MLSKNELLSLIDSLTPDEMKKLLYAALEEAGISYEISTNEKSTQENPLLTLFPLELFDKDILRKGL